MKILRTAMTLLLLVACQAQAELIVIGDVDAPNTSDRPQNYALLENVRNGGTDILWLTGGFPFSQYGGRYTDLRARWTNAGATITDDLTTGVSASLSGRDLVVISHSWCQDTQFDASAVNAVAAYLAGGGEVLLIAQVVCGSQDLNRYNPLLTAIGSTMQFMPNSGWASGDEIINTATPYGAGVTEFELNGWTAISGGIAVVTLGNEIGVAYGSAGAVGAPVPASSNLALLLAALGVLAIGGYAFARRRPSGAA